MKRPTEKFEKYFIISLKFSIFWMLVPYILISAGDLLDFLFNLPMIYRYKLAAIITGFIPVLTGAYLHLKSFLLLAYLGEEFPVSPYKPKYLITCGSYKNIRHPMYAGYIIFLLGMGIIVNSISYLILIFPLFSISIIIYTRLFEERNLINRFDKTYLEYKRKVPFIIPSSIRLKGTDSNEDPGLFFLICWVIASNLFKILFKLSSSGRENIPQSGPFIIISNHLCYLDPFFITSESRRYIRFLTTIEVFRDRVNRWIFYKWGAIPKRRYALDLRSIKEVKNILSRSGIVGIFPEGERSWDGRNIEIPSGNLNFLLKLGVPLVPVRIKGSYMAWPRWSPVPRKARVEIRFFRALSTQEIRETKNLNKLINSTLHSIKDDNGTCQVKGLKLNRKINTLLWCCPLCYTNESLIPLPHNTIKCKNCQEEWIIDGYHNLKRISTNKNENMPLSRWYDMIVKNKTLSFVPSEKIHLGPHETIFLRSFPTRVSYGDFPVLTESGVYYIFLTGKKIIFSAVEMQKRRTDRLNLFKRIMKSHQNDGRMKQIKLSEIRSVTIEGDKKLQLGMSGNMVQLNFERESSLKWQIYLNYFINQQKFQEAI